MMIGYQVIGGFPDPEEITTIYDSTPEGPPARATISVCSKMALMASNSDILEKLPADFVKDLLKVMMQKKIEITGGVCRGSPMNLCISLERARR
jgi:hypothetical protein